MRCVWTAPLLTHKCVTTLSSCMFYVGQTSRSTAPRLSHLSVRTLYRDSVERKLTYMYNACNG